MEWVLDLALIGACGLIVYFNRSRRPAWIPPLAIACFVVAGIIFWTEAGSKYFRHEEPEKPLPKVEDVRAKFEATATAATTDVFYHGAGYSLDIPQGYRYAKLEEPMLLLASRGDKASVITILKHNLNGEDPEPLVRQMLELMKKGNASYEFSELTVSQSQQMRTWFRVTKNDVKLRGLLVFAEREDKLWQLTLTEPQTEEDANLLRIADTWTVD
jgi:hypothetical protein